jgi:TonB family protein
MQHDEVALHQRLKEMLVNEARAGRKVLLFIDEAQNLRHPSLEAIRLLSDFETARTKLLHIVLSGSAQLGETLRAPELSQLAQRIATVCRLETLTPQEVNGYVTFRLGVAGCRAAEQLFSPEALAEIAEQSEGIPRVVNSICYRALVRTYAGGERRVSVKTVRQAARDLDLAHPSGANGALFFEEEKQAALNAEAPSPALRDAFKELGIGPPPTFTSTVAEQIDQPSFPQPQAKRASEALPQPFPREGHSFEAAETNRYSGPTTTLGLKPDRRHVRSSLIASALIVLAMGLGAGWYELQVKSGTAGHDSDAVKPIAGPIGAQHESSRPSDSAQIHSPNAVEESNTSPADGRRIGRKNPQAPIVETFPQSLVPSKLRPQRENPVSEPTPAFATNISKVPDSLTVPVETMPKPLPAPPEPSGQVAIAEMEESATANQSAESQTAPRPPIKIVRPTYPKLAELRSIEGDVVLELQVDSSGKVQAVRTLSGDSLLGKAAEEAAWQWQFPRSENQAVSTFTRVKFNFKLPAEINR